MSTTITREEYFEQTDYLSNSMLKSVVDEYEGRSLPEGIEQVFDFGRLVHHIALEPEKADRFHDQWDLAFGMAEALLDNRVTKMFFDLGNLKFEHEFYRTVEGIKRRCKCDIWAPRPKVILDFKGLSVASKNQFLSSIQFFDYDQQGAWYLDITGATDFIIVAASKAKDRQGKHPTWTHLIRRGSEDYDRGKAKYLRALEIFNHQKN